MRFVNFKIGKWAGCALALPFVLASSALAGEKPEKIEFSDPAAPVSYSNLNRLPTDKSFSQQIKEDLFKPYDSMKQEGTSLDPVMPQFQPPRQPVTPDRRQRELMDRRRNWAFVDSADLLPKNSLEDMLQAKEYGPDGREKKDPSAIDKYYEKLGKRQGPTAIELSQQPGAGRNRDFAGTNAFNSANFAFSTNESVWSIPSGENTASLPPWTANGNSNTVEQLREKQHRADFSKLLDGRVSAPIEAPPLIGNPITPPAGFGFTAAPAALNPYSATTESKPSPAQPAPIEYRNPASPLPGATPAQALYTRPHVLDDPTLRALGLPQPPVKLAETPKAATPTMERAAEFSLPQRKF